MALKDTIRNSVKKSSEEIYYIDGVDAFVRKKIGFKSKWANASEQSRVDAILKMKGSDVALMLSKKNPGNIQLSSYSDSNKVVLFDHLCHEAPDRAYGVFFGVNGSSLNEITESSKCRLAMQKSFVESQRILHTRRKEAETKKLAIKEKHSKSL